MTKPPVLVAFAFVLLFSFTYITSTILFDDSKELKDVFYNDKKISRDESESVKKSNVRQISFECNFYLDIKILFNNMRNNFLVYNT